MQTNEEENAATSTGTFGAVKGKPGSAAARPLADGLIFPAPSVVQVENAETAVLEVALTPSEYIIKTVAPAPSTFAAGAKQDICHCALESMVSTTTVPPYLMYNGTPPAPHPRHDTAGDVKFILPPTQKLLKAKELRSLVTLIPGTNTPERAFCHACSSYRNNAHTCDPVIGPVTSDWLGDSLHCHDVRRFIPAQTAVCQEQYTSGAAQTAYLKRWYPSMVLPPPAGDHANATAFESAYFNDRIFRFLYLFRTLCASGLSAPMAGYCAYGLTNSTQFVTSRPFPQFKVVLVHCSFALFVIFMAFVCAFSLNFLFTTR
jgi:hypothetical protein